MITNSFNRNTSGKTNLIWSGLCMSSPSLLNWLVTQHFDEHYKSKQNEWFLSEPEYTILVSRHRILRTEYLSLGVFLSKQHHLGLKAQSYENRIFTFGCLSLKAIYNSYKLQRLLHVTKFLFMSSFTTLLLRHLPTEIVISINVFY